MEDLRHTARAALQQPTTASIPDSVLSNIAVPDGLNQLWQEVSSYTGSNDSEICENLLVAQGFLKLWGQRELSAAGKSAVNSLYAWASGHALPSSIFAESPDESSSEEQDASRRKSTLAISVISLLAALLPVHEAETASDVIIALASFTSEEDPWTTPEAYASSTALLKGFTETSDQSTFWSLVESILKTRVRPLFAKTKNPAITAAGRKNFHPVPLPRFDLSILDPETKPWKAHDVYITTTFSWIVSQYQPSDRDHLELHFPLLVPPILALIDDDSLPFQRQGCLLLSQLLLPIRETNSDILQRTNLSSVFEDAIRPCFHSLPTLTPEDDSIRLLSAAYPALRSLLQTSYALSHPNTNTNAPNSNQNTEKYTSTTTKTLRDHLIPSFHHISSTNPTSHSTFASFPHPRLSAFLLQQIATTCSDLAIHTTKYLQDTIPLIYSTLSNPFGTAYPPLLLAGVSAARAIILNAHPRIWRWRGEILGAVCSCWAHIIEEEEDSSPAEKKRRKSSSAAPSAAGSASAFDVDDKTKTAQLGRLKRELQGVVYLLRYTIQNPVLLDGLDIDKGQLEAKESIGEEMRMLVEADETLGECLLADVDPEDPSYFGLD